MRKAVAHTSDTLSTLSSSTPDHSSILDSLSHSVSQNVVVNPLKELGEVCIHHYAFALLNVASRGLDRVVCPSTPTKPVTMVAEGGINQGLQHLQQCLLDESI